MKWLDFVLRQKELLRVFRMNTDTVLGDSEVEIRFFNFNSTYDFIHAAKVSKNALLDGSIVENLQFSYPVFFPKKTGKQNKAIVLLHGLNERNWDKYLCWAEYLAVHTKRPVILFPIAYHMNRSPNLWSDPRLMSILVKKRQERIGESRTLCFANVALSERLSEDPVRFYTSGKQTIDDLTQLTLSLQNGDHPMFSKETTVDFFAYSIGSFLAEIALMINPLNLFNRSKLFVFCGGSIFRSMFGESRFIMDKTAYDKLMDFYQNKWLLEAKNFDAAEDVVKDSFSSMISPEIERERREHFFSRMGDKIFGISLKKDLVMPFGGVEACMGDKIATKKIKLLDFPYAYSHESPFPTRDKIEPKILNNSFNLVFSSAVSFFG